MLFAFKEDGTIDGTEWCGIPEFTKLSEPEFRCVAMIWDNQGPYWRMDAKNREERVTKSILGKDGQKFLASERYKIAQWMYRAIDVDGDKQLLEMYTTKLASLVILLGSLEMSEDQALQKKYEAVNKNVQSYMKTKAELEDKINERGKMKKSFKTVLSGFEKFQERSRLMRTEHEVFKNRRAEV